MTDKPGCVRLADFEKVARLAESKNLELMLGLTNRTNPAARKARELVESGLLGKLYGTSVHLVADHTRLTRPSYWTRWVASRERAGGGKLIYHGIHYLDLVHYIAGDTITEVTGFAEKVGDQPVELEDSAVLSYRLSRGTVGTLNTGYYLPEGYSTLVKVWGSLGWLRFDSGGWSPHDLVLDAPGRSGQGPILLLFPGTEHLRPDVGRGGERRSRAGPVSHHHPGELEFTEGGLRRLRCGS